MQNIHESYGLAGFTRSTIGGSGTNLFGSSIKHSNTITFRVYHAEVSRDHDHDWYSSTSRRTPIVEIEMSQSQFAEMITSMNIGDGFPVTIRSIEGTRMENCPHESKRQQHANEFKDHMVKFAASLEADKKKLYDIIEKRIPKKDQQDLKLTLDGMLQEIRSNIPFYEEQFARQMERTVTEAKGEVEAFVNQKIHSTGLKSLMDQENKMLS